MLIRQKKAYVALLLSVIGLVGCPKNEQVPRCSNEFNPITADAPVIPQQSKNIFQGFIKVDMTIEKNGSVSEAKIVSVELQPMGRGIKEPMGYVAAVKDAVRSWVFPQLAARCKKEMTIEFELGGVAD